MFNLVGSLAASGAFRLHVPSPCHGGTGVDDDCEVVLKSISLNSVGSVTVGDETISNVRLVDNAPLIGSISTEALSSMMILESPGFGVTGDISSHIGVFDTFTPNGPLTLSIDWATGIVSLTTELLSSDGTIKVAFYIQGAFSNLPPTAVANAASPVECGHDPIGLEGIYSYDPEGPSDIGSYNWTADLGELGLWTADGVAPALWLRTPGRYRFFLTVSDTMSSRSVDFVDVDLLDSLPPVLDVGPDVYLEACEPSAVPFFDIDLEDDCDTEPTLEIRIIEVNGVATDLPYTPSETRLPFGKTILEYTARDEVDNIAVGQHAVYLERGASCCPAGSTSIFGTTGNDVINGLSSGSSCLLGFDGDDSMTGAGSLVSFFGGRGDDVIDDSSGQLAFAWGGLGHDDFYIDGVLQPGESIVSGGAGNDVVIYSADRPVRIRGGAGMDDLNSTTSEVTTFVVGAPCEVEPGEFWQSYGPTVVESPITLDELGERGLIFGFGGPVTYVKKEILPDAECF